MTEEEATAFEKNPDANLIIRFREWDDQAKITHTPVDNIQRLKEMTLNHLMQNSRV